MKKYIVCLGTRPWGELPDRTQQIMAHLKGVEILYFHPPKEQQDKGLDKTNKTTRKKNKKTKVRTHIHAYTLPKDIPNTGGAYLLRSIRQKRLGQFITHVMAKHHVRHPLVWASHPAQEELTSYLNYSILVYDCNQYWDEELWFPQEHLLQKADLIFTTSKGLKRDLLALNYNRNIALLLNGVNYPLFEENSLFVERNKGETWFGFAGVIDYDLDLSPLLYVAKSKPKWKFLLMGPCPRGNPSYSALERLPNVEFFGQHAPHKVSEFLFSCHVLMEFRYFNRMETDINSIRLYEYFATGRPIVGNLWPNEIERFPDVVYSSFSNVEFLEKCTMALEENPNYFSARRKKYAKNAAWHKRSDTVLEILSTSGLMQ